MLAAGILTVPFIGGCASKPETYVQIDGERFKLDEFFKELAANEVAARQYIGKEFEAVSSVVGVEPDNFSLKQIEDDRPVTRQYTCENGYVSLEGYNEGHNRFYIYVEVSDEDAALATELRKGDFAKVAGTYFGYSNYGNQGHVGLVCEDGHTTHIEKLS